jgi:ferredoxin-NADP reductase
VTTVTYQNKQYQCGNGSLLDSLLEQGVSIPFSCKSGLCQACEMKVLEGVVPTKAQVGLPENKIQAKHFLACQCFPEDNLVIASLDGETQNSRATLIDKVRVNRSIVKLILRPEKTFSYLAGQYIRLYQSKNEFRCYSIASNPDSDRDIELHIQVIANGKVSPWLANDVGIGEHIELSEAMGTCIYPDKNTHPTLFIASNSGLAPIYGMLKKALFQGDKQEFRLYHGVTDERDKYLVDELTHLSHQFENLSINWFDYSLVTDNKQQSFIHFALSELTAPQDWKVYFCGSPDMVSYGKKQSFLKGVSMKNLFSDSFIPSKTN